jgi:hypothetical protein
MLTGKTQAEKKYLSQVFSGDKVGTLPKIEANNGREKMLLLRPDQIKRDPRV